MAPGEFLCRPFGSVIGIRTKNIPQSAEIQLTILARCEPIKLVSKLRKQRFILLHALNMQSH